MSISELHPHPSPAAVLAEVVAAVRELDSTWWTNQTDDELVTVVAHLQELRAAAAAVQAGAVAEADTRDLGKQKLHYGSTADWLTHTGGLRKGHGKHLVTRAHALTGPLSATREALAAGRVSPEQADVIVTSIDQLPTGPRSGPGASRRCWSTPGPLMPPTWRGPVGIWCTWSTPTPTTASWNDNSTGRNEPPTSAGSSRSPPTGSAGCGSRAAAPPKTAPS